MGQAGADAGNRGAALGPPHAHHDQKEIFSAEPKKLTASEAKPTLSDAESLPDEETALLLHRKIVQTVDGDGTADLIVVDSGTQDVALLLFSMP